MENGIKKTYSIGNIYNNIEHIPLIEQLEFIESNGIDYIQIMFKPNPETTRVEYDGNKDKFYSCKIYENDILIRDLQPCLYNKAKGLWDKIDKCFYELRSN